MAEKNYPEVKPIDTSELIKKQEAIMMRSLGMADDIQDIQDKAIGGEKIEIRNIYELEVAERLKRVMAGIVESKESSGDKSITVNIVNYGKVQLDKDNQVIDVTPPVKDDSE